MIRSSHRRQGQENQLKGHLSVKSGANNGQCTTFFPWNASRTFDYFSLPASTFPHNLNGRETPPKRSTTYRPTSNYIYLPTHCPPTYLSSTSNAAVTERKAVEFEKQKRRFSPIFSPHLSSARNSVRLVPPATTRLCQGHGTWGCRRTKLLSIIIPIWQLFLGWDLVLFL